MQSFLRRKYNSPSLSIRIVWTLASNCVLSDLLMSCPVNDHGDMIKFCFCSRPSNIMWFTANGILLEAVNSALTYVGQE